MSTVVVIGGGAAGMMASITASKMHKTILIEKNEKLGKKIYITGKGRCNLSNYCEVQDYLQNVVNNSRFITTAMYSFTPKDTYDFFEQNGLKLKIERGDRVFPASDKASDVTKTLERLLIKNNVEVRLNTNCNEIIIENNIIKGVNTSNGFVSCDKVILCTGGVSYSATGSTGDGYKFAKNLGHTIVQPKPALCGIELKGSDFISLQGLSLKNVEVYCYLNDKNVTKKLLFNKFGEMLFTHFGVSGPIILTASSYLNKFIGGKIDVVIDLKPALEERTLENRLIRELPENATKNIYSYARGLVPSSLVELVLRRANISKHKKCAEITANERLNLINSLKNLSFEFKKLRPIEESIITSGGIKVSEINPKTFESKLVKGLFFAGEVIDVDCLTGGYNLQFAFSSGFIAGKNC